MIDYILLVSACLISALMTFVLIVKFKLPPVLASAVPSLIVGLIFYFAPYLFPAYLSKNIPAAFIGASFAGMTSVKRIPNAWWMALSGLFFGLIYLNAPKFFSGFGGGLGTSAFLSVVMTIGLMMLTETIKKTFSKRVLN